VQSARYLPTACSARLNGVTDRRRHLTMITAGSCPSDLSEEEKTAYDIATSLLSGGVLSESAYQHALGLFGQPGVSELIYLVGHYCFVSITLNGFDQQAFTKRWRFEPQIIAIMSARALNRVANIETNGLHGE
jgi:hypothetical protein